MLIRKYLAEPLSPVTILGLTVSGFSETGTRNNSSITRFLGAVAASADSSSLMNTAVQVPPSSSEPSVSKIPLWARGKNAPGPLQARLSIDSDSNLDEHGDLDDHGDDDNDDDDDDDAIPEWVLKDMAMQNDTDTHIVLDDDDSEEEQEETEKEDAFGNKKIAPRTSTLADFFKPAPAATTCHECFAAFDDKRNLQEHLDHHVAMRLLEEEQQLRLARTTPTSSTQPRKRKHIPPARAASPPTAPPPKRGGIMQWLSRP